MDRHLLDDLHCYKLNRESLRHPDHAKSADYLRRRSVVRSYRLILSLFLLAATAVFGQRGTVILNGHAAAEGEIIIRLKATDPATVGRVRNAFPNGVLQALVP